MGGAWHTLIARLSGREADYIFIKLTSAHTRNQGIDLAWVMAAPNGEIWKANGLSPHPREGEGILFTADGWKICATSATTRKGEKGSDWRTGDSFQRIHKGTKFA